MMLCITHSGVWQAPQGISGNAEMAPGAGKEGQGALLRSIQACSLWERIGTGHVGRQCKVPR